MSKGDEYRMNADKTKRYLAEIAELKAENDLFKAELRKITRFHIMHHLATDLTYGVDARKLIGSLEGIYVNNL